MPEAERLQKEPRFKVWRTVGDEKTRETHQAADGQVRFVGEPFQVGDALLMEPRDAAGPPEETYNCRCIKEEYTLSDLPKDLLAKIEHRLTEEQRLLARGIRVADAGEGREEKPERAFAQSGLGTVKRSDFTLEEFLEAIDGDLFERVPLGPKFIRSNEQVADAVARVDALATTNIEDVVDNPKVNAFVNEIAEEVAKAKIKLPKEVWKTLDPGFSNKKESGEKVFSLGFNEEGDIIVQGVMVFPGQGGDIRPIIYPDTIAIVHVHFGDLKQPPHGADNNPVVTYGIPSYVINSEGNLRWAIGVINGQFRFRSVNGKNPGPWKTFIQ